MEGDTHDGVYAWWSVQYTWCNIVYMVRVYIVECTEVYCTIHKIECTVRTYRHRGDIQGHTDYGYV